MHGFIFGGCHCEKLRQADLKRDRNVSVFADYTAVFHGKQRQLDSSVVALSVFLIVFFL